MNLNCLKTIVVLLIAARSFAAESQQVMLAWNPVVGATITNYTLSWAPARGLYF